MTHSTLSVIVPVRNEQPTTLESLVDLAHHTGVTEVIVVDASDQYSTVDKLNALQTEFETLRVIHSQTPGRAHQMNQGGRLATGEILWFIHADTRVPPDSARRIVDSISANRPWGRFDVRFENSSKRMKLVAFMMNWRSAMTGICTGDQAIFITRGLFDQLGGFPDIAIMEDVALTRQLKRKASAIRVRQPVTTSARRWESRGYLKTVVQMWFMRLLFWIGVAPGTLARFYR